MPRFTPGVATGAIEGRLYLLSGHALAVVEHRDGARVPFGPAGEDAVYIGALDGVPCFARPFAEGAHELRPVPLRQLFGVLDDDDFGVATRALGLLGWDHDHRFCGRCGGPTVRSATERMRSCVACGHGVYPRLSPAVIVLVEREGKALLARNPRFPLPFWSTLAGFVEVGETLEQTVAREVREEAGIDVGDIRYFGSQPWPFSGSLMIGFTARWTGGDLDPDPTELAEAGWFAPHELPPVPPKFSIARALIEDFVRRTGVSG
ncbi:MAG: NAD(+) diphosphatase [Myxococcota bacterium]